MSATELKCLYRLTPGGSHLGGPVNLRGWITYRVRAGDTLARIAASNGVTFQTLLRANPAIANPNRIVVGQTITIPLRAAETSMLHQNRQPSAGGGARPNCGRESAGPTGAEWIEKLIRTSITWWEEQFDKILPEIKSKETEEKDPPWLMIAKKEMYSGVQEASGSARNPRIADYVGSTNYRPSDPDWDDDDVPWCSAFVNWCVKEADLQGTNSMMAISWKELWKQGKDSGNPAYGAIGVIRWHREKATCLRKNCKRVEWWDKAPRWLANIGLKGCTKGHVGFVVGMRGGAVVLLGGNQSDQVKLSAYSRSDFIGFMFPKSYQIPEAAYQLPEYTHKEVQSGTFAGTR